MPNLPFLSLDFQHRLIERDLKSAFSQALKKGNFILGDQVNLFEREFANYHESKYCVGVGNGHDALLIALKTLGVGAGDEVIVPSHTCQATWLAVMNAGAKPVAAEVDPATYTIGVKQIEDQISKRTRAIIPVHLYGYPCEMDKIMAIAKKHHLLVVEDNAQAHGAIFKNRMTGRWGTINATSFYPTKNLGALGDGGAILTNDKKLGDLANTFRNYGSNKKGVHSTQGFNSRLDEIQAAVLRIKLKKLNEWNEMRTRNAELYFDELNNVGDLRLPPQATDIARPVFHLFVIQTAHREKLKKFLSKNGLGTSVHYPIPVHLQPAYSHLSYKKGSLPIAEGLAKTVLSLPIYPGLKKGQIETICEAIKSFF